MRKFKGYVRNICAGLLFLMVTFFFAGETLAQTAAYCSSSGTNTRYEWINSLSLAGFYNASGANNGYADNTGQVITLLVGPNSLSLSPGFRSSSYLEYWKIWIDFNKDGTFTEDESVFNGASRNAISGSINIPDTAPSTTTRMRVSMRYGGTPQPCGSFSYGEVEDYTVILDTVDTASPTIITKSPDAAEVDVTPNAVVRVTFSEEINPMSLSNSSISLTDNGQVVSGIVSLSGSVATFTPDQPLAYSKQYTVTVFYGLRDLAGNPLLQDVFWSFNTMAPDTTAPTILNVYPKDNEIDVLNSFVVKAIFSEPMNPATINATSFTISDGVGNISGSVVLGGDGKTAQFFPNQPFDYTTEYTVKMSAGVQDLAGNSMLSDYAWRFTSRAFALEYCSSFATNYSYMWISKVKVINFTFTSLGQPGTGYSDFTSTVFNLSSFNNSIYLTPGFSGFSYTTYWRVFIDWDKDGFFASDETVFSGSGNSLVSGNFTIPAYAVPGKTRMRVSMQYAAYPPACGSLSYGKVDDFRVSIPAPIGDTTAPAVLSVNPVDGAQGVNINTSIAVDFSEPINASSLNGSTLILSGGQVPVTVSVTYDSQTSQALFTPLSSLEYDTLYTATLGSGVEDVSGNAMLNDVVWSFTTEPEVGPTYSVSGLVQYQGVGMAGVVITVSGDASFTTTTSSTGTYNLTSLPPGSYTLTPDKVSYGFIPASIGLDVVDADLSAVDFTVIISTGVFTNGDFETGDFSGFNTYTTSNGSLAKIVVMVDTDNNGAMSLSAAFNVGTNGTNIGPQEGGGIYQTISLAQGDLSVTMDIAAYSGTNNVSGGLMGIYLDGVLMKSHDFANISAGIKEYATLSFSVASVSAGAHEIRIQITRPYMTGGVVNYVDDIVLSGSSTQ